MFMLLIGCQSQPVFNQVDYDAIKIDIASLNKPLRGYLLRKVMKDNLSSLTEASYVAFAYEQGAPSEKEYLDFLKNEKPEIALAANTTNFAICIKALSFRRVICDNAKTGFTDFEGLDLNLNLKSKAQELLTEKGDL